MKNFHNDFKSDEFIAKYPGLDYDKRNDLAEYIEECKNRFDENINSLEKNQKKFKELKGELEELYKIYNPNTIKKENDIKEKKKDGVKKLQEVIYGLGGINTAYKE